MLQQQQMKTPQQLLVQQQLMKQQQQYQQIVLQQRRQQIIQQQLAGKYEYINIYKESWRNLEFENIGLKTLSLKNFEERLEY